jgi:uncharacterized protein (TIGR02646 family)
VIRVERGSVAAPPSLATAGVEERERAIAHYREAADGDKAFTFTAYKAVDVVTALTQLFGGKCAYCESLYAPVTPADIEHFRPKGDIIIEGGDGRLTRYGRGYYWLAADWDNLLASCPDCNRRRKHEFPDEDPGQTAGKGNWFPLINEGRRAYSPGEERTLEAGQRLLLHPCRDRPERHLDFLASGVVRARSRSRKGELTIKVLGLHRAELNAARNGHLLHVARKIRDIVVEIDRLEENRRDSATEERITERLRELREWTRAEAQYAAMARQFIAAFERAMRDREVRRFAARLLRDVSSADPKQGRGQPSGSGR